MEYNKITEIDKLHAESDVYHINSKMYDLFSEAEDSLGKIEKFLVKKVKNKVVLDFGCGTGKFIPKLASHSKLYFGIDVSSAQLKLAKQKSKGNKKVKIIKNPTAKIPLESDSIDIIFSTWAICSIHDLNLRKNIINEMKRVLRKDGSIYLITNDVGGNYKKIVEENHGDDKTKAKFKWLENNGFEKVDSFQTFFEFESLDSAKEIFESIFGKNISSKIKTKKISHNIVIYKNEK